MGITIGHGILLIDAEHPGVCSDRSPIELRRGLRAIVERAAEQAGLPAEALTAEDRGGGLLVLVAGGLPPLRPFLPNLVDALRRYNSRCPALDDRLRLRVSLHVGRAVVGPDGSTGPDVDRAVRLCRAEAVRRHLFLTPAAPCLVVSSERVHRAAPLDPARPVDVVHAEGLDRGWLHLPSVTPARVTPTAVPRLLSVATPR
ncbi:MAG TPA: hypothetical protein VGD67_04360 [Pseudonocardiaceae bacterium]